MIPLNPLSQTSVSVKVRCVGCEATREIGPGQVARGDVPMCTACFSPMVAVGATAEPRRGGEALDATTGRETR